MILRIGHLSTFYHTSILLTAEGNLKNLPGIDVQWRLYGTGPAIVNAFKNNEIDLAYIGLPPAVIGIDEGVDIKCIAGGHIEGTVLIGLQTSRGYPETDNLKDILRQFRGYRIGVPGKGSIHDVIISEYLDRFHLRQEIEIVNYKWADQIIEAMHKKQVASAAGTPALAVALERYCSGKILCPPAILWPNNPSYGILVTSSFLNTRRDIIGKFLFLHEEATAFLRSNPVEAAKIIAGYIGIVDGDFIMDVLRISPKYCAYITDEYISATMDFVKVLKKLGYINREISSEEIFDTSLIKQIHPLHDHYQDGIGTEPD